MSAYMMESPEGTMQRLLNLIALDDQQIQNS